MKKSKSTIIALLIGIVIGGCIREFNTIKVAFAATGPSKMRIADFMTPQQFTETGVAYLNEQQRAALDDWFNDYTMFVIASMSKSTYSGVGGGHWISDNIDNGSYILLEDGSLWEIDSLDTIDTSLWLSISNITVIDNGYNYILINTDDGEKAEAKFLGYK